ncbi:MAG: hypothetical protein IJE45_04590 [Bacilli bacterium]|nr:hypothetical protein [Bacilli bacterium]
MKKIKKQLELLNIELNKQLISRERVIEIKNHTLEIASMLDTELNNNILRSMVNEIYKRESKYLKRQVKKSVKLLIEYVS